MASNKKTKFVPMKEEYLGFGKDQNKEMDEVQAKSILSDTYWAMTKESKTAFPDDIHGAGTPATLAIINVPSQQTAWLATSARNGRGPMVNVHPTLAAAVGAGNTHRTSFAGAEMHAVNRVLQSLGNVPEDAGAKIFGTPGGQDPGPEGGKIFLQPYQSVGNAVGCQVVLKNLGIPLMK
ncbi:hypothetical protein OEA41_003110 [Lepraria neglecta]|uniref:Uncharacterized protein n=1 Tax=Lepraria neglecta TaxID=209136 RepID=A0AAE0DIP0_9LECA|nr:hypothetical protein OEA41_003110 [Lepraria neglecta]